MRLKTILIYTLAIAVLAAVTVAAFLSTTLTQRNEELALMHESRLMLAYRLHTAERAIEAAISDNEDINAELQTVNAQMELHALNLLVVRREMYDILQRSRFLSDALAIGDNAVTADLSDLRIPSGASEAQINTLLENTPLYGTGWYFLEAERKYSVNAIVMIAIMRQESGIGTTGSLWRQNNFAGISNGRGGWQSFDTARDGVFALARLLGVYYLCHYGRFHRGVSLDAVNVLYAPLCDPLNRGWAPGIRSHTAQFLSRLEATP